MIIDFRKELDNLIPLPKDINNIIIDMIYDLQTLRVENKRMFDLIKLVDMLNDNQIKELTDYQEYITKQLKKYNISNFELGKKYKVYSLLSDFNIRIFYMKVIKRTNFFIICQLFNSNKQPISDNIKVKINDKGSEEEIQFRYNSKTKNFYSKANELYKK
jgi:hypothetical protein